MIININGQDKMPKIDISKIKSTNDTTQAKNATAPATLVKNTAAPVKNAAAPATPVKKW